MLTIAGNTRGEVLSNHTTDSTRRVAILFPFDSAVIERDFEDNPRALDSLQRIMTGEEALSLLDSVVITGAASPEGAPSHNRRLALRRANSLREYIVLHYPHVETSRIQTRVEQRYWEGLIEAVERNQAVPGRDELLATLRDPRLSDETKNSRMNSMMGGNTFAYLRDNYILRHLRTGSATVELHSRLPEFEPRPEPLPEPRPEPSPRPEPTATTPSGDGKISDIRPIIALRTNLLADLVGAVNAGVEVPIGRHFSVAGDFAYAYTRIKNTYAIQAIQGTVEASWWIAPRRGTLTGWKLGVYGTYNSRFDIQWGRGVQGDGYWSAGVSAGYSLPLSKTFNLGFSALGGYFHSPEIREYGKPRDGHLIWEKTRYNVGRIALTQVRVDLVWLINKGARR